MDIFCTAASLANATASLPHDRYLDCVDQSSLLLPDAGVSARRAVFYWLQSTFSGLRIAEYKYLLAATYWQYMGDNDRGGGLSGDITKLQYGKLFNLYTDPKARLAGTLGKRTSGGRRVELTHTAAPQKEEHSDFIRNTDLFTTLQGALQAHLATFRTFPPPPPSVSDTGAASVAGGD